MTPRMTTTRPTFFAATGALLFLLCGLFPDCKHSDNTSQELVNRPDYTIKIGKGGGFAGLYSGYTVHSGGTVEQWTRMESGRDSVIRTATLDTASVDSLERDFRGSPLFKISSAGTGNMTNFIEYRGADTTARWSWPVTTEPDSASALDGVYNSIVQYCKRAFEHSH